MSNKLAAALSASASLESESLGTATAAAAGILVGGGSAARAAAGDTNPAVGWVHGNVYLFIADGRPAAVMAIYKWFSPWTGFEAELQSLATGPVRGFREDKRVWHPDAPGITLRDVPDAPRPGASAAARGRQMRAIAAGFATRLVDSRAAERSLQLEPRFPHAS